MTEIHQMREIENLEEQSRKLKESLTACKLEVNRLRAALRDMTQETEAHHAENVARVEIGGSDMAQRKAKAIVSRSGVLLYKIKYIARAALEGK